jgi:methionyl-tRNA synthetase
MSDQPGGKPQENVITFDDFTKVKLRVGRVVEASDHPNADKLLVMKVDLGDEQRQICAGLKEYYKPEELVGKNLVVVTNLAPRMMRGQPSNGMLLAAVTDDYSQVVVISPERDIPPGTPIS